MTKKTITVISVACTLGLLCISVASISTATLNKANAHEIVSFNAAGNINYVSLQHKDGAKIALSLSDNVWQNVADENLSLNQGLVQSVIISLKNITATGEIKKAKELSQYGLDSPSLMINFKTDSEDTTYLLGTQSANGSEHYFTIDGENAIYTVSNATFDSLNRQLIELVNVAVLPVVSPSEIYEVTLKQGGETLVLNNDARQYTVNGKNANKVATESYFKELNAIFFEKCAAYKPASLAEYGLDNPAATVEVYYTKEVRAGEVAQDDNATHEVEASLKNASYTLIFGGGSAEGTRYVMLKDSDMVCTANAQTVADLTELDESDFA